MKKFIFIIICALLPVFASAQETYWEDLQTTIEHGSDVLTKARESGKVDQWMLEELEMFLERGNEMYKEHTASEEDVRAMIEDLEWRIQEVEEAMKGGGGEEPYAVLSENNTVLTFYYDDQKASRGGMDVGPFSYDAVTGTVNSGWDEQRENIEQVVFDESFANCTTITSTAFWFSGFKNLTTIIDLNNLKTDNVENMCSMFWECANLTSLDLSGFNTEKVTDMTTMFSGCPSLTSLDVSGFNTANVTNMSDMFAECSALTSLDVSGFNTANVTNMERMFNHCFGLTSLDVSGFKTENVTNMLSMFFGCSALTTIYVGNDWTTDNVEESENMFLQCTVLVGGAGTKYDKNHTDHTYAHIDGGVDNPGYLTRSGSSEEEPYAVLSENNTVLTFYYDDQKTARGGMDVRGFFGADERGWDSAKESITTVIFDESFANCTTLTSTLRWFMDCSSLSSIIGIENLKTDNVTDMTWMFTGCSSLTSIDLSYMNTANVTKMHGLFNGCSNLTNINLSGLKTTNVTTMNTMFCDCSSLTSVDVSSFHTRHVTDMEFMFYGCSNLTSLDLVNFDTSNVTNMNYMFRESPSLTAIYVSDGWSTASVSQGNEIFTSCENLVGGLGTKYDPDHNGIEYAHIDGGVDNPGYLTSNSQGRGNASFDGLTAWVWGDATLNDAFANVGREAAVKTIAAILWDSNNELTPDQLQGITNPNLLVYVNDASIVPDSIQNVIVNGTAEEIILTDATGNNNFYCPKSFTAKSISYSRDFSQTTEIEVSRGWETIALPFDVQSITHESHGTLVPFGGEDSGYHFWLRQLYGSGLAGATQIRANIPYLISMPNNTVYPSVYNQNGTVTFSSTDVTVPETSAQSDGYENVTLHAAFQQVEQSSSIYALNVGEARGEYPEGSVFEQNYREIRPFQAYTTHSAGTRFIPLGSLGGNDDATGIQELKVENSEFRDAEGAWYSLDGRRLYSKPTRKGVYVKDGRKIVIK